MNNIWNGLLLAGFIIFMVFVAALWTYFASKNQNQKPGKNSKD